MQKIKNLTDLNYQLEIEKIRCEVELDKLKRSIRKTQNSIFPAIISFAFGSLFRKKKRK